MNSPIWGLAQIKRFGGSKLRGYGHTAPQGGQKKAED